MPQPRSNAGSSGGSSGSTSRSSGSSGAKRTTSKSSSGSGTRKKASSTASAKRSTAAKRSSTAKRSTAAKRTSAKRSASSGASRARSAASSAAAAGDQRFEAVASRIRKLNDRIIEASKEAGETTLSAYEKALKSLASSMEHGAGSSDVEWVSQLLNTQAKFIRDMTSSWTSAARKALK